ncbi:MAG: hypothetical protein AB1644_03275 [Candidatus Zixiibacteriota bacterium]
MSVKRYAPAILLVLGVHLAFLPACDKLVTEVNNNTYYDSTLAAACLTCHDGGAKEDEIIKVPTGQWAASAHASTRLLEYHDPLNDSVTSTCGPICHASQGFIKYDSIRVRSTVTAISNPAVIGCNTCHMAHSGKYGQWRMDTLRGDAQTVLLVNQSGYELGQSNMCAVCHQAIRYPLSVADTAHMTLTRTFGPHFSAQADVVASKGGYPLGGPVAADTSHALDSRDGCLMCHFGTGQGYEFGEHSFRLENKTTGEQYIANCNVTGCHTGPSVIAAQGFYSRPGLDSLTNLAEGLRFVLELSGMLGPDTVPVNGAFVSADSARVLYNYLLFAQDGSRGIHNPKYMYRLLKQSLDNFLGIPPSR